MLHDLAALLSVFLIMVRLLASRPEKRVIALDGPGGWVTRQELAANHDPQRVARGE